MKVYGVWIDSNFELPPSDGVYEVTNYAGIDFNKNASAYDRGYAYYDGYGFKVSSNYVMPNYWRSVTVATKKYGKRND